MLSSHDNIQVPNLRLIVVDMSLKVFLVQVWLSDQLECLKTLHNFEGKEEDLRQNHTRYDCPLHNFNLSILRSLDPL